MERNSNHVSSNGDWTISAGDFLTGRDLHIGFESAGQSFAAGFTTISRLCVSSSEHSSSKLDANGTHFGGRLGSMSARGGFIVTGMSGPSRTFCNLRDWRRETLPGETPLIVSPEMYSIGPVELHCARFRMNNASFFEIESNNLH